MEISVNDPKTCQLVLDDRNKRIQYMAFMYAYGFGVLTMAVLLITNILVEINALARPLNLDAVLITVIAIMILSVPVFQYILSKVNDPSLPQKHLQAIREKHEKRA